LAVLGVLAVLLFVGYVTLGPSGAVADGRRAAVAGVQAVVGPWLGTVSRTAVEAAANVLLFVPVGAMATAASPHRRPAAS
jgi:hypothetical protein